MSRTSLLVAFSSILGLTFQVSSQSRVWVVDDGAGSADFRDIQAAVDHASDGDTVLVMPGAYPTFTVDGKSVTVTTERPGRVAVMSAAGFGTSPVVVENLTLGQRVVMRGIDVSRGVLVRNNDGLVWIEGGSLVGGGGEPGLEVTASQRVLVVRCRVQSGVRTTDSDLYLDDSTVDGAFGAPGSFGPFVPPTDGGPGGIGMSVEGGSVFALGSTIRGGVGGGGFPTQSCGGPGGTGLHLSGASPTFTALDTSLEGGAPGSPVCHGSGAPSLVSSGTITTLPGAARRFSATPVVAESAPTRWSLDGVLGDEAALLFASDPSPQYLLPWNGLLLDPTHTIVPLGTVGASPLEVESQIDDLGADQALSQFVQGLFVSGTVGYLASPSHSAIVDLESPIIDCDASGAYDVLEAMRGDVRDDDLDGVPDSCEAFVEIHVDDDAAGDPAPLDPLVGDPLEDGSISHPFDSIQEGIDAASPGIETVVLVHGGVYQGVGNVNLDFGGRALSVRAVDGRDATKIRCGGNARAFVFQSGETHRSRVEGFTIRDGAEYWGGAIFADEASPTIVGCRFEGNRTTGSSSSNTAGGAIRARNSGIAILDCEFVGNVSNGNGGAIEIENDNVFLGVPFRTPCVIRDCRFEGNVARSQGGAVWVDAPRTTVSRCAFFDNAADVGGALYLDGRTWIDNSILTGNVASVGGGVYTNSRVDIDASTVVGNRAKTRGGALACSLLNSQRIRGSIFWDNASAGVLPIDLSTAVLDVDFSDLEGGASSIAGSVSYGGSNFDADPAFRAGSRNFRLTAASPCVNAGDPAYLPSLLETDLVGGRRRRGGRVDVGATER